MKNGILILLYFTLFSCMPEEELPMKDMGEISGYFIECYCKPGEFYTLNAAKVSPIHEIIDLNHQTYPHVQSLVPRKFQARYQVQSIRARLALLEHIHARERTHHGQNRYTGPYNDLFLFRFQSDKLRHDQFPNLTQPHAELLHIQRAGKKRRSRG